MRTTTLEPGRLLTALLAALLLAMPGCTKAGDGVVDPPRVDTGSPCLVDADCVATRSVGCDCKNCNVRCEHFTMRGRCVARRCTRLVPDPLPGPGY